MVSFNSHLLSTFSRYIQCYEHVAEIPLFSNQNRTNFITHQFVNGLTSSHSIDLGGGLNVYNDEFTKQLRTHVISNL